MNLPSSQTGDDSNGSVDQSQSQPESSESGSVVWTHQDYRKRREEIAQKWRSEGLRYFSQGFFIKQFFGQRVQKVSIDAGLTCPNVDGTVAYGGCNFCDNRSFSPSRRLPRQDMLEQIDEGIKLLRMRYNKCNKFVAYFQPATNTYAPVEKLRGMYFRALEHPDVVGMAIGTRPDCVPEEVMELLEEVAQQCLLTVEYGMQTVHDHSLDWMNRGHHHDATVDAIERSVGRGFEVCLHAILGLPTEDHDQMMETADEVVRLGVDSVKIHNLYVVKNTPLALSVEAGDVQMLDRDNYVRAVVDFIEKLPPDMIVERISGDAPRDYFIGPSWCLDKPGVLRAIEAEFINRDSWQGKHFKR